MFIEHSKISKAPPFAPSVSVFQPHTQMYSSNNLIHQETTKYNEINKIIKLLILFFTTQQHHKSSQYKWTDQELPI